MKRLKPLLIVLAVLAALYFMPFITVETSDSDGTLWRVPFGTSLVSKSDDSVTFSGFRSGYALAKDSENALHAGEEVKCYGETYYYREDSDISLEGYTVDNGIPATVTFHYRKGNACLGWTGDDEVAWEVGAIEDADLAITSEEAMELDWFVIQDGKALNPGIYNDFSRLVKQGVFSILRTLIIEGDDVKIVDIQLLENAKEVKAGDNVQEAFYRAAVKTKDEITEDWYTRYSETTETNPRIVSVYQKDGEGTEHETVLFTYSVG